MAWCLFNFFHLFSFGPKEMLNKRGRPLIGIQFTEVPTEPVDSDWNGPRISPHTFRQRNLSSNPQTHGAAHSSAWRSPKDCCQNVYAILYIISRWNLKLWTMYLMGDNSRVLSVCAMKKKTQKYLSLITTELWGSSGIHVWSIEY